MTRESKEKKSAARRPRAAKETAGKETAGLKTAGGLGSPGGRPARLDPLSWLYPTPHPSAARRRPRLPQHLQRRLASGVERV
jgi:hypothetical protein